MKRLFAVAALVGALWCGGAAAGDLPAGEVHTVGVGAGYANVAPEILSALMRNARGNAARMIDGFALDLDAALASPDAYALYPATGSAVAGRYAPANAWRVWGGSQVVSAVNTGDLGYSHDALFFTLGAEKAFGAFTLGGAVNYTNGDYDARKSTDKTSYHGLNGLLYGRYAFGDLSVQLDLGYGRFWGDRTRWVDTNASFAKSNDHDLDAWFGAVTAAYRLCPSANWVVTPSVGFEYYYVKARASDEKSWNALALHYAKHTHNYVRTPFMVTVERPVRGFGNLFTPYARVAVTPEWHHDRTSRYVVRAGVDDDIEGPKPVRVTGMVGAGLTAKLGMRTDLSGGVDFEFGRNYRNTMFHFDLGFSF